MGIRVVAVDIGRWGRPPSSRGQRSMRRGRSLIEAGTDRGTAVSALASGLLAGAQAALLLEAPMSVPVPGSQPGAWRRLGKARDGEGSRPWSAEPTTSGAIRLTGYGLTLTVLADLVSSAISSAAATFPLRRMVPVPGSITSTTLASS